MCVIISVSDQDPDRSGFFSGPDPCFKVRIRKAVNSDPDLEFSGSDPDLVPIRIRTREWQSDPEG